MTEATDPEMAAAGGEGPAIFALSESREFGAAVARNLGRELGRHEERDFEDGEHKLRPLERLRDRDAYVVQSLFADEPPAPSVHDKLCRLLFFCSGLRDAGAARVTAVVPYLCYARKDRRTRARDPITSRYVVELLEASGIDALVALEVHNLAAFQNACRVTAEHIEGRHVFAARLADLVGDEDAVVVSPDPGGFKRADRAREDLQVRLGREVPAALLQKRRRAGAPGAGAPVDTLVGEAAGRVAVVVDDLIASGGTLARAARVLKAEGARAVIAAAAHGLFTSGADEALADPALDRVLVTTSVPPRGLGAAAHEKLEVASAAEVFAAVIERLHAGRSVADLLGP